MIRRLLPLLMTLFALAAPPAEAALEMLNVRLVKLTPRGTVTPGLEDVAAIIRRNLPYAGCEQIDRKACRLPANATLAFRHGWRMMLKSRGSSLDVTLTRKKHLLLSTSVTLKADTPLIMGGFHAGSGGAKHVFVLQGSE